MDPITMTCMMGAAVIAILNNSRNGGGNGPGSTGRIRLRQ